MNRRIAVLPDHLANKIAAGEVIQRPESVVKELVENSLDAGGQRLSIVIQEGGKKLIQVADDGMGMDETDAVTSFLRHATSKIASYEDLEEIRTYGFRGEALASVAAVAQVTMKTRRADDDVAVVVRIDGGGTPRLDREGRERGTLISVHNLFYNVPARRKFLKSASTEFRHIYDVVARTALSRPDVALEFISDDETIFNLDPAPLQERMVDVFGERLVSSLLPVEETGPLYALSGFVGKPEFGQRTRGNQFLFLNRRYIVNRNINHAVFSAYEHLLTKGTFPMFVLFLGVDPHRVDVNVHPSKLEAKFEDEQGLYRFVSSLVRRSLGDATYVPSLTLGTQGEGSEDVRLRFTDRQHVAPSPDGGSTVGIERIDRWTGEILPGGVEIARQLLGRSAAEASAETARPRGELEIGTIWQLHQKYILYAVNDGVLVVDQHVAHERVLYERAMRRFADGMPATQQLLFPRTIQLNAGDYALLQELFPYITGLGFDVKVFGKQTVVVDGVPTDVRNQDEESVLAGVLGLYREYVQHAPLDARDTVAKSFACRSAVKAGDTMSEPEMRSLLEQLGTTTMPFVCPHGRPVMLRISLDELDRRFGRT
jgi:DNA mismatch repair protein MutL